LNKCLNKQNEYDDELIQLYAFLEKKFGRRWRKARELIEKKVEVKHLTVTRESKTEISGIVKSKNDVYACYLDDENILCTCRDQTVRKVICKHLLVLLNRALEESKMSLSEFLTLVVR